jgi:cation:H+ antiporter
MMLAVEILALLVGFYFLAKGSDWLVTGASAIAEGIGVRPLVVGLTVVAWGTSAPEVVVSGLAAFEGKAGITLGNVLGSNVANIGLVLGTCGVVLPAVMQGRMGFREIFWFLGSVALFWWRIADSEVTRLDAVIMLAGISVYNLQLLWEARQASVGAKAIEPPSDTWLERNPKSAVLIGMISISAAAKLVMIGATGYEEFGPVGIAVRAGLSDAVIGFTVIAVGTSLPELAAGLSGAFKGHADISIGNVVGSNVFNVLGVIGIVGLIQPFGGEAADAVTKGAFARSLAEGFPVTIAFSVAAVLLPWIGGARGGRWKGALLLAGWVGYTAYQVAGS